MATTTALLLGPPRGFSLAGSCSGFCSASAPASAARLVASSRSGVFAHEHPSWPQLSVSPRRTARVVVCSVSVELGGSQKSSEGEKKVEAGTRIRVLGPLKVYHVPKHAGLDIGGFEGEVKEVVTSYKGKPVSATFPFKMQLMTPGPEGRKFFAHLKVDEFEVVE